MNLTSSFKPPRGQGRRASFASLVLVSATIVGCAEDPTPADSPLDEQSAEASSADHPEAARIGDRFRFPFFGFGRRRDGGLPRAPGSGGSGGFPGFPGRDAGVTPPGTGGEDPGAGDPGGGDIGGQDPGAGDPGGGDVGGGDPGTPPSTGGKAPRIPQKSGTCPEIKSGTVTVLGQQVTLTVGPKGKKGPMVFYWHGTGSTPAEARSGLGNGWSEILAQGGVIASFSTSTKKGQNTGNNVWYTGDFEMADQLLACAVEQQLVDPRRVYTAGCSAGGLQASAMVYGRSSYLAAAMPNSGGTVFPYQLEDPSHIPPVIATHGAQGRDVVIVDFSQTTARQAKDIAAKGGFFVECDHGGGHCGSPAAVKNAQWEFLKAHPFGVTPEPYAGGLPASFPSFCKVIGR